MANELNRLSFPEGFMFGASSAAYQYEGEANKRNRGPSVWDYFCHDVPARVVDRSNGDVAIDFYNRYKGDVQRMKELGLDVFRFSISWSRVIPGGALWTGINKDGINFYNDLINDLVQNGIKPMATIFHWDTPQALEDLYGGFLSRRIVDDFRDYADLCFKTFGDRVKMWVTMNEPWGIAVDGYDTGLLAPGKRTSHAPYIVGHNLLLAHAGAVQLYREQYQALQGGMIGFVNCSYWFEPYSSSPEDQMAAKRSLDFMLGWFLEPCIKGHYPKSMRNFVGKRLPTFTPEETELVKGSIDFFGLNHYTTFYAKHSDTMNPQPIQYQYDVHATWTQERDGVLIGPQAASSWLCIYPPGMKHILTYIKTTYENPTIIITENGVDEFNDPSLPLEKALQDPQREFYYKHYLKNVLLAIKEHGVDVRGHLAWSLLDNFEWVHGFTTRFGFYFVDYNDDLKRHPKTSVSWYKSFLNPILPTQDPVPLEPGPVILNDNGGGAVAEENYETPAKKSKIRHGSTNLLEN